MRSDLRTPLRSGLRGGAIERYRIAGQLPLALWDFKSRFFQQGFSFSRAGAGTYIDGAEDIQTAAVNVPRYDYSTGIRSLLMEGEETNLAPYYEISVADWTNNNATLTQLSGDYAGVFDGVRVASQGATFQRINSNFTVVAGTEITVQFWYALGSSGGGRVSLRNNTLSLQSNAVFDGDGNVTASGSGIGTVTGGVVEELGNVRKISFKITLTQDCEQFGIGPFSDTAGEDIVALGCQVEVGDTPTSNIPTDGAAASRASDISTQDISDLTLEDGCWVVLRGVTLEDEGTVFQTDDGDNSNRNALSFTGGNLVASQYDSTEQATASKAYVSGDKVTLAIRYAENDFAAVWPDGTIATGTSGVSFVVPDAIYIAANNVSGGNKPAQSFFEQIAIYEPGITPEQMIAALGL